MSNKIQVIKRLDAIKNLIELEDEEMIHLQIDRLKQENNPDLAEIIQLLEADAYESLHEAIDKYVTDFKTSKLTPHQQAIFEEINKELDSLIEQYDASTMTADTHFLSLKGSAGVGKTFVTSKLVESFLSKNYKVVLTTPTHKSLKVLKYMVCSSGLEHVSARTLHSFLNITLDHDYNVGTRAFRRNRKAKVLDDERDIDIVLVDESSMISRQLLGFLNEDLLQRRTKTVLFIGDEYQLPPVDEDHNAVVDLPKQFALTEVVRQAKDSYIKQIAIELKECIKNKDYVPFTQIINKSKYPQLKMFYDESEFLSDFTRHEKWFEQNNMLLSFSNDDVDRMNRHVRNTYWTQQDIDPTPWLLPGDHLVAGENDFKIMNSEVVKIKFAKKSHNPTLNIDEWMFIDTTGRKGRLVDPDSKIIYNEYVSNLAEKAKSLEGNEIEEERKKAWRHYFALKSYYGEFKYVYASTVHKSQGSTYNASYISMPGIVYLANNVNKELAYRMLYVAVTRASKDLVFLF